MKKNILVVARPGTVKDISEWSALKETYALTFVQTDEQAIELAHQLEFDLVLVDGKQEHLKLRAILPILLHDVEVMNYEGESVTALDTRVAGLFEFKKNQRLKRMLGLDSTSLSWNGLPPFSSN